jgi:hypothetical protein
MAIEKVVKDFVREFYVITYLPKKKMIFFEDDNEGVICESTPNRIELGKFKGQTVCLNWGNIKEITGIEYHHKEYVSDLTTLFSEIYHNKITRDLFQTFIDANVPVSFTIKEMINFFPTLE